MPLFDQAPPSEIPSSLATPLSAAAARPGSVCAKTRGTTMSQLIDTNAATHVALPLLHLASASAAAACRIHNVSGRWTVSRTPH